jgi:hypothetical protein
MAGALISAVIGVLLARRMAYPVLRRAALLTGIIAVSLIGYVFWRARAIQAGAARSAETSPKPVPVERHPTVAPP